MRIAAIILNVLLLISLGLVVQVGGIPSPGEGERVFIFFLLVVVTPIFTLLTLFLSRSESWLSLYFKRKAAEERKRIAEIKNEENSQHPAIGD